MKERLKEIFGDNIRRIHVEGSNIAYVRLNGYFPKEQIEEMISEFTEYATSYTYYQVAGDNNSETIRESYFYYEPTNYTHFCLFKKEVFNEKKKDNIEPYNARTELYRIVGILNPIVNGKKLYKRILIQRTRNYWGEICNMKYLTYKIE